MHKSLTFKSCEKSLKANFNCLCQLKWCRNIKSNFVPKIVQ